MPPSDATAEARPESDMPTPIPPCTTGTEAHKFPIFNGFIRFRMFDDRAKYTHFRRIYRNFGIKSFIGRQRTDTLRMKNFSANRRAVPGFSLGGGCGGRAFWREPPPKQFFISRAQSRCRDRKTCLKRNRCTRAAVRMRIGCLRFRITKTARRTVSGARRRRPRARRCPL